MLDMDKDRNREMLPEEEIPVQENEFPENTEQEETADLPLDEPFSEPIGEQLDGQIGESLDEQPDEPFAEPETEEEVVYLNDEYPDYADEDDENNLAAVAERITGARHTVAATAAPIRIRETGREPTQPKPTTGIPVRAGVALELAEKSAAATETDDIRKTDEVREADESGNADEIIAGATADNITDGEIVREDLRQDVTAESAAETTPFEKKSTHKRTFAAIVVSAVVLLALLGTAIVAVNRGSDAERPADITIGEQTAENAEILVPDAADPETTDSVVPESTADPETAESDTQPESTDSLVTEEPETTPPETEALETEPPETKPEPVKFTVTIDFYDKEDVTVVTEAITLADLLAQAGVTLTDSDVPAVALDSTIAADSVIAINKQIWSTDTVVETLAYSTEVVEIDTIPRDMTNYIQYGENGEVTKTYAVEYINGVEVSRTLTGEETTKWPVNEIYELGVGGSFVGADGATYTYSYRRVVPATYYNIEGLTYLGTMADESVIAVDRDYIPLGTRLYIKNDSYDFGVRIASDVGSMIEGWEVDIWLDESNPQFASFAQIGYHYDMEIYYID